MKKFFLLLLFNFLNLMLFAQPAIILEPYTSGFDRPVDITHCGDDRLFIVEQDGVIHIIDPGGNVLPTPFLDIDPIVGSSQNEQGLLGLAFHPDYLNNGYFYVNYTRTNGDTRVSRFSVSAANPNVADPNSEVVLLDVDQPFGNHNGGCIKFGPDGYLYIGLGDGGSGGDPQNNGQNRLTLLGKLLRIDVDNGSPYTIPADNPFADDDFTLDEIWALGLRNPWRFSFDRVTGDLWIGDVGQNDWEEIDFQPADSPGGENYGWRCYEGNHNFNTGGCEPQNSMTFPVAEYSNSFTLGCSVTGGFVYRGCEFPGLYGHYLFADYCSGRFWSVTPGENGSFNLGQIANLGDFQYVAFGENNAGHLFVAGLGNGVIARVTSPSGILSGSNETCTGTNDGAIQFTIPTGELTSILWNDGSTETERTGLSAGNFSVVVETANGCTFEEEIEIITENLIAQPPFITLLNDSLLNIDANWESYQWLLNGVPIQGANEPTYIAQESGDYSVAVTSGDCELVSNELFVSVTALSPEALGLDKISLTPNPFSDDIYLKIGAAQNRNVEVMIANHDGMVITREKHFVKGVFEKTFKLHGLPPGLYIFSIKTKKGEWTKRIIKQ